MQFSDIVASLKLAAQKARNSVNARRAGSINKQHLRGAALVDGGQFNPAAIDLHGNLLVVGAMGTGKPNAAMAVAAYLAEQGESFFCYDAHGEYAARLCRGRDHILNPYDERGECYNVFADLDTPVDVERFARAFFPSSAHPNSYPAYQRGAARTLVEDLAALTVAGEGTNEAFCTLLYDTPVEQLADLVGAQSASLLIRVPELEALSIARVTMRGLRDLKSGDFSLREALARPDTRVFITSSAKYRARLAPLNTFLLGRVCQLRVNGPRLRNPPPILVDEFGTLDAAPQELLEATQEQMIRLVLCVQSLDQLTRKFGAERAEELRNYMRNTLVFRARNDDDCEASAGYAQGLVRPEEIRQLADNRGFLHVADSNQVAKVTVPCTPTEQIAKPFVPREDLSLSVQ